MSKLKIVIALLAAAALLLAPASVSAQPLVCGFHGSVTLDGAPVADGTVVQAWVGTTEVGKTTTSGSNYNLRIAGKIRYDHIVTKAQIAGKSIVEYSTDGVAADIKQLWSQLLKVISNSTGVRGSS